MACAMSVSVLSVPSKPAVVLFSGHSGFFPVTLKCVKESFSRKGLLFAKRTFIFAKRTFIMAKTIY